MKKPTIFIVASLAVMFVITKPMRNRVDIGDPPRTIYDTAIAMLRDFVLNGHDTRLGFTTVAEAKGLWIDIHAGIPIYYVREDTLLSATTPLDSQLIDINRVVYPVYTQVGDTAKLCSSITFDSSSQGWRPVIFEDSSLIAPFLADRAKTPRRAAYAMVAMPFINDMVILKHDSNGEHVVATRELRGELGKEFPHLDSPTNEFLETVDVGRFVHALIEHIHLLESHHRTH